MADIDITRSHSLGLDDGRAAVGRVADKLETELGVDAEWTGDTLQFSGQGADGHIDFLQPMRSRVQAEAEDYLDQSLQSQS
jgi:putative polyhydroxyalkanoate system protein